MVGLAGWTSCLWRGCVKKGAWRTGRKPSRVLTEPRQVSYGGSPGRAGGCVSGRHLAPCGHRGEELTTPLTLCSREGTSLVRQGQSGGAVSCAQETHLK